ncbi:hypothetical protein BC939DRAFT_206551 [Gamsiella multidivaricata]|uniref:uncharacterized protein n=1 Tax=Gamsiella multidivaricata TaxID=101098 RepID=UPI00221F4466|nr:uncharacterized protein BC939DRAFT_206551 [Gamsiella multidivaricata]KAI7821587.1 hypothetical protein BC939DRAFT_206551 [Gamsiella multidivaricata]
MHVFQVGECNTWNFWYVRYRIMMGRPFHTLLLDSFPSHSILLASRLQPLPSSLSFSLSLPLSLFLFLFQTPSVPDYQIRTFPLRITMGNYISYSQNDIIFSGILIAAWLLIRPYFVRMSEQAQARSQTRLEAEAAANDALNNSGGANRGGRRKLD